ncbi:DUF2201 family putative metallopeptidase [Ornithinimicrobium murale]|uniref:vWA domain-containing protein n=1 Tax=Ornithinimicrobium murale TaxID=1050153 RepID=UPI000E0DF6BC|nr:VWA-like domain-containing protein [Ornithinimicrobium murale]
MVTIRPLTQDERRALSAAHLNALEFAPYFATALFKMQPVAAEGLGTFAVDRGWRLYIDPITLAEWGPQQAGAVLTHEVGHLLREHAARGEALGAQRNHDVWNLATDAAINADLLVTGMPLPEGAITPENQGLPRNGIEEDYYHQLNPPRSSSQSKGQGSGGDGQTPPTFAPEDGCGSGAGGPEGEWELAPTDGNAPALSDAAQRVTRRMVAESVNEHAAKHPGTTPAGLRRWASEVLTPPQVDWRRQLRSAVRRAVVWAREGQQDYTYARPGRRRIPRIITPSMHTPVPTIAAVIDTSGSMSPADLAAALSEVAGITKSTRSRGLSVVSVDTQATVMDNITNAKQVELSGGGGTDMRVGIAAAQKHRSSPDVIVVLTDGFTPWPDSPTPQRVIAALIGEGAPTPPAWITTVQVTPV